MIIKISEILRGNKCKFDFIQRALFRYFSIEMQTITQRSLLIIPTNRAGLENDLHNNLQSKRKERI